MERVREDDGGGLGVGVELELAEDAGQVDLERIEESRGENGGAFPVPFWIADDDLSVVEVEVFDPQAQAFHQAQAAAVEELSDQAVASVHATDDQADLVPAEDSGDAAGDAGADRVERFQDRGAEDLLVEEEDGAQGLVLGGCGDLFLDGEVGEEGFDIPGLEVSGVLQGMVAQEAADPGQVGAFGAQGVVFPAEDEPGLLEQAGSGGGHELPLLAAPAPSTRSRSQDLIPPFFRLTSPAQGIPWAPGCARWRQGALGRESL